jgi:hypothetical protein
MADSDPCGRATKFGIDDGDRRVNHGDRKDGAPAGATAALGLKSSQNWVLTAGFAGISPISESSNPPIFGLDVKKLFAGNPEPGLFNNRFRSWLAPRSRSNLNR